MIQQSYRVQLFATTTTLGASAVYTSPSFDVSYFRNIYCRSFSDQAGSFVIQHSDDGVTWDSASSTTAPASTVELISYTPFLKYARLVYTNGGTAQTTFRFSAYGSGN